MQADVGQASLKVGECVWWNDFPRCDAMKRRLTGQGVPVSYGAFSSVLFLFRSVCFIFTHPLLTLISPTGKLSWDDT
jgi:hypothetical protein